MWRVAHGRLAAIAVLAGGLSSCTPAPAPRTVASADDDKRMHCGYRSPLSREVLAPLIETEVQKSCGASAAAGNRYGEIRVVLDIEKTSDPRFVTEGGEDLSEDDRICVLQAAHRAVPQHPYTYFSEGFTLDLALGAAPPLLPSTNELFDRWLAAKSAGPARKRFEAELPAEVVLHDDCLSIPLRPGFNARVESWLAAAATPVDKFWQPGPELLRDLEPISHWWTRAYLRGDELVMIGGRAATDGSRQEICLVPLDDRVRQKLQYRVERRATCWAGDLRETLLHPRTAFPADRRYKTIAVGDSRACALDERGEITCCGARLAEDIPAGPFASLAIGGGFDCGITTKGSLHCWGQGAPAGGAEILGPYAQVAVSGETACAVRRDTGEVECWLPGRPTLLTLALANVREMAWIRDGLVCGVISRGASVRCWRGNLNFPSPRSLPPAVARAADPSAVALAGGTLAGGGACALDRSGRITCVPQARDRWTGQYRAISGGARGICAVTADGRVDCDREWP